MERRFGQRNDAAEDPLAYGDYHKNPEDPAEIPPDEGDYDAAGNGERGIVGDTYRKLRGKYQQNYDGGDSTKPSSGLGSFVFHKLHDAVNEIGSKLNSGVAAGAGTASQSHTTAGGQSSDGIQNYGQHRYGSFAGQRSGNDAKWYVDGCSYMWAVSRALEQATTSIWILDWWLSPELYLRRPPSRNEHYRLDRMLQAAAQRGVKVNIIVYKEVTQALTLCSSHTKHALEALHPNISVFRHPDHLPDAQTLHSSFLSSLQHLSLSAKTASTLPIDALKAIYGMNEDVILYWAHHEKLCLIDGKVAFMGGLDLCYGRWDTNQHPIADCHPSNLDNTVFPGQDYNNARVMDFQDVSHWQNNKLNRKDSSRMGWSDVSISLSGPVVDDLGAHFVERWNFIYDEKYDVRKDVRYSRLTFSQAVAGAVPPQPFVASSPASQSYQPYRPQSNPTASQSQQNYGSSQDYEQHPPPPSRPYGTGMSHEVPQQPYDNYPPPPPRPQDGNLYESHNQRPQPYGQSQPLYGGQQAYDSQPYFPPPPSSNRAIDSRYEEQSDARGFGDHESLPYGHHHHRSQELEEEVRGLGASLYGRFGPGRHGEEHHGTKHSHPQEAGIAAQIVRSCTKWSHGVPMEHSIANAYISVIENSQHFVYIENQFFITATSDAQKPVKNKVGAAIVRRIVRAAQAGEKFKVIVVIPAIPAFAGDLKDDASLGTRAIMEFQYNSINRGGYSIMEMVVKEGYDPNEYISFYNLRNYDRINVSGSMRDVEQRSGVDYEVAREQWDEAVELPAEDQGSQYADRAKYQQYQQATTDMRMQQGQYTGRWDSVSECYMLGGRDIREVPWEAGDYPEIKAFVSEELYVHSKICIADDRIAIVGSANLNDRSQLGDHDSEIAIVIEDPNSIDSYMDGRPYRAARFAATLRRQLFRKHLGLLRSQDMEQPDQNFEPISVPNTYDYGSREDQAVMDPLSDRFLDFWNSRAKTNSHAFGRIFHPVPHDDVQTWQEYDSFYESFFHEAGEEAEGKEGTKKPAKYQWGHVVEENFPPGDRGTWEVKELLSTIRGTLVDMPLQFLIKEDIAKEGLGLNAFTEEVYT